MESVASSCRPAKAVDKSELTFTMTDRFTGREITVSSGNLPEGYEWGCLVPAEWWANSSVTSVPLVSGDIYNLLPLDADTRKWRGELAPGDVTAPTFSNQFECRPRRNLRVLTDLYSPPVELRGELARACFYMSVVYHADVTDAARLYDADIRRLARAQ